MNAKKMLALLLALAMVLGMAACGGSQQADTPAAGTTAAAATGEKPVVKFSYPVLFVTPTEEGTAHVEDALNAYLDSIGESFHVDLDPNEGYSYANNMDMALLGNSTIDVFCPFSGLSQAISGNKMLSLNDYLDNELAGAVEVMGKQFLTSSTVNGNVYALPCYKGMVLIDYWMVRKDVFDQTGLDPNGTYDLNAITDALAKLQKACPDIPAIAGRLGTTEGNTLLLEALLGGVGNYERTALTGGASVFGDSTTVENYYESDMFTELVNTTYAWNQAGYVPADASIETEDAHALVNADRALSYFIKYGYERDTVESSGNSRADSYEMYAIPVAEDVLASDFIYWGIAHSCQHPSEAARFLNMLYTDETLLNLIIFGIEGEDYVITDDTGVVDAITWPDGMTMETVSYTAALSCGILGNQFIMHAMEGSTNVSDVSFMENKMENAKYSPLFGFSFDTASIANEVSAVSTVVAQYLPGFACGELNPAEYLPKFQADLKSAGIDSIVAEAQKQVDTWLAAN